jgi:alkylglycerol monooxygenase
VGSITAGVGEVVFGLFFGPILLTLYDFGFAHFALVHWPNGSLIPWVLAFLLGDLCYYLYHPAGHAVAALWAIHGVHHQADEMNVSVALRHPWLSDVYSAPFYALLPMAGVPPTHFFVAIALISFYALTVHSWFFQRPGFGIFVTPASHVVHHAKNPRYLGKNLGAMFTLWDRLFGPHVELDPSEPLIIGSTDGYRTYDGALAQWMGLRDLWRAFCEATTMRERLRVLFNHPGYRPPETQKHAPEPARDEALIPPTTKLYVGAQLVITLAAAAWILWLRAPPDLAPRRWCRGNPMELVVDGCPPRRPPQRKPRRGDPGGNARPRCSDRVGAWGIDAGSLAQRQGAS